MLHEAHLKKGLMQQRLADRCGKNKAYILMSENDVKKSGFLLCKRLLSKVLADN